MRDLHIARAAAHKKMADWRTEHQNKLDTLHEAMKKCPQTKNQSVWDHGESVNEYFNTLKTFLESDKNELEGWRLSDWLLKYRSDLLSALADENTLDCYTLYHDCGKPFCREVDAEGKQHFPNHAIVSRNTWLDLYPNGYEVADLIAHDMDIHLLKSEEVESFCKNKNAASLLLVGLSELHSNATMFGGIESTSFKIKWKQIDKRGKAICEKLFGKKEI